MPRMPKIALSPELEAALQRVAEKTTIYEEISLPSRGVFYNGEDGPANGVIHIRPMTGAEEQILATQRFVRKGNAVNMIFQRCMQEKFDTQDFLTPDRTYLLIYLRGISYTPQYDAEIRCAECSYKFSTTLDLNELYVDYCPKDFDKESLAGALPESGLKYNYRLSRGSDEQKLTEHRERKDRQLVSGNNTDDTLTYRTVQLLEDVAGVTDKDELMQLVQRLHINDVAHLRNILNEPPFGVDTKVHVFCPSCNADFDVDMPIEANFFFPRSKKGQM
jgi:hypothetical protein